MGGSLFQQSLNVLGSQPLGGYTDSGQTPLSIQPTSSGGISSMLSTFANDALQAFDVSNLPTGILPGSNLIPTYSVGTGGTQLSYAPAKSSISSSVWFLLLIVGLAVLGIAFFMHGKK